MGVGGKAIPPDKIENIQSDAKFILLVEKEAAYIRITMRYGCSEGLVGFIVYFHFLAHR
jgi:DNA topoisomerase VI subunit A